MATILESPPTANFARPKDTTSATDVAYTYEANASQERKHAIAFEELPAADEDVLPSKRTRVDSPANSTSETVLPSTQNALMVTPDRSYRLEQNFPVPQELGKDEVMIRTRAVGLNHIDWKSVESNSCLPDFPWVMGREMAGVVEKVGPDVSRMKAGDAVWTCEFLLSIVQHEKDSSNL